MSRQQKLTMHFWSRERLKRCGAQSRILAVVQARRHVGLVLVHVQPTPAVHIACAISWVKVALYQGLAGFWQLARHRKSAVSSCCASYC